MKLKITKGNFKKFGVTFDGAKTTFTFEVTTNGKVALALYSLADDTKTVIDLDSGFRFGRVYSVCVSGINPLDYSYMIVEDGISHLDPYATRVIGRDKWNDLSRKKQNFKVRSGMWKFDDFKDESPEIPSQNLILYRMHMRGFTMDHSLSEAKRGNYEGVIQRLSYLKDFGFNALEFQPLYDFEEVITSKKPYVDKRGKNRIKITPADKVNYWGYGKASYFAPKASYFGGADCVKNMRKMIHAIHKKGMKIIMEMSFSEDESEDMMLDCLKFWVSKYHIDGFRIVGLATPIERVVNDPILSDTYFFYDSFPEKLLTDDKSLSRRLFVDDTRFMYPLRKLINHKDGSIVEFTNMMRRQNERYGFVNFCASSNSGYTLLDSFSYKEKHNEANGEENRDGNNFNFSDNYGNEGETNSRLVWNVRLKNCRTSMAATILAQSIPMIQSGDEVLNSQKGNNNPYCQDNEIGWVNFNNKKRTRDFKAYVKKLFEFRQNHPVLWTLKPKEMSDPMHKGLPDLSYHGREPWTVWLSEDRKAVGILYSGLYGNHSKEDDVMLLFNFYLEEERFALPSLINQRKWYFVANTSDEVWPDAEKRLEADDFITVPGSSLTILVGKTEK